MDSPAARAASEQLGGREPPSDEGPACREPKQRSLLLSYAFGRCVGEDALAFEVHLLTCDACFQDLQTLDRASVLVRELTDAQAGTRDRPD